MKKNITAIMLAAVIFLAGCGASGSSGSVAGASAASSGSGQESTVSSSSESGQESAMSSSSEDGEESSFGEEEAGEFPAFDTSGTIEETKIYDKDNLRITANSLTYTDSEAILNVTFENATDKTMTFTAGVMGFAANSINQYMVSGGYVDSEITPGNSATEEMTFDLESLQLCGINQIADVGVNFEIEDPDYNSIYTGMLDIPTSQTGKVDMESDPYQESIQSETAKNALQYEVLDFSAGNGTAVDTLQIQSTALLRSSSGEASGLIEVKNTGTEDRNVAVSSISVNGLKVTSSNWSYDYFTAGKTGIIVLRLDDVLSEEEKQAVGITDFGTMDVELTVENADFSSDLATTSLEIKSPDGDSTLNPEGTEIYNEGGLSIRTAGTPFEEEVTGDADLFLIASNTSGHTIRITDQYDSFAVNGSMTDYLCYDIELNDGESGLIKIEILQDALIENGISGASMIKDFNIQLLVYEDENEKEISIKGSY